MQNGWEYGSSGRVLAFKTLSLIPSTKNKQIKNCEVEKREKKRLKRKRKEVKRREVQRLYVVYSLKYALTGLCTSRFRCHEIILFLEK
jgi:hypothetical protein